MAESASRTAIARSRMADFQSPSNDGTPISLKTSSTIASMRSSLLATWRYSAIGPTPSSSPSRRMVRDSIPPSSARAMAACSTRARDRRPRRSTGASWIVIGTS
jgi:hypothetical protein